MICELCSIVDDQVVRLSSGIQVHPVCFKSIDSTFVNRRFSGNRVAARKGKVGGWLR